MGLKLVTGMPLEPHSCTLCGKGPRDENGNIRENVFAEAVDINWGDSVYICPECGFVVAELYGCASPDRTEEMENRIEDLEVIEGKYEELSKRVKRILDGQRARKEVTA